MKRSLLKRSLLALALILPAVTWADFQVGLDAYNQGDFAEAYKQWLPLAEQGVASAQFNLGLMYANGEGVPKDDQEAVRWLRLAAEQGLADAQYSLGLMYANGEGVPQDSGEAVRWYRQAAEQGVASAQYNLGVMYDDGRSVSLDYVQAHMWLSLAASRLTGEDRARAVEYRDRVTGKMTLEQIDEAQRLAREFKPKSSGSQ